VILKFAHFTTILKSVHLLHRTESDGQEETLRFRFNYRDEHIRKRNDSMEFDFVFESGRFRSLQVVKDTAPVEAFWATGKLANWAKELFIARGLSKHPLLKEFVDAVAPDIDAKTAKMLCEIWLQIASHG
jgi:hypothetical protein